MKGVKRKEKKRIGENEVVKEEKRDQKRRSRGGERRRD